MDLALLILIRASTYALVAVGFALVFGSCRVLNLTHGFYVMLGAYATHFFAAGLAGLGVSVLREPLAVLGAAIATGLFGWLFFKLMQVTRRTAPAELLPLSVAANLLGAQTFQILFGTEGLNVAPILQGRIVLGHVTLAANDLLLPPCALLAVGALPLWLQRTRSGMALRAVADDADAAELMGIRSPEVLARAVGIAAVLAGLAGGLTAPTQTLNPNMWIHPLLVSFAVVVLGGRGRIWGSIFAAFLIALGEVTVAWVWNETAAGYAVPVLVLIGLLVRPGGIAQGLAHEIR